MSTSLFTGQAQELKGLIAGIFPSARPLAVGPR